MDRSTKASKRLRKTVTFDEIVQVNDSLHLTDMTSKEISNSWYTNLEYGAFKQLIEEEVRHIVSGTTSLLGPDHFTHRGLESQTPGGNKQRNESKSDSIKAVLDEQQKQKLVLGRTHPNTLRDIYLGHSSKCVMEARLLGKGDELEVQILNGDFQEARRDSEKRRSLLKRSSIKSGKRVLQRLFSIRRVSVKQWPAQ